MTDTEQTKTTANRYAYFLYTATGLFIFSGQLTGLFIFSVQQTDPFTYSRQLTGLFKFSEQLTGPFITGQRPPVISLPDDYVLDISGNDTVPLTITCQGDVAMEWEVPPDVSSY